SPLLRREGRSLGPTFEEKYLLSAIDYWRVSRFRAQTRLRSHGVLASRQERFALQLGEWLPDPRSGLIIGDLTFQFRHETTTELRARCPHLLAHAPTLGGDAERVLDSLRVQIYRVGKSMLEGE